MQDESKHYSRPGVVPCGLDRKGGNGISVRDLWQDQKRSRALDVDDIGSGTTLNVPR
jgi:hypothetical protein